MASVQPVAPNLLVSAADGNSLLANLAGFARLLRFAGFACGPDKISAAAQALCLVGIHDRTDARDALANVFVESSAQREQFTRAFDLYFCAPRQQDDELAEFLEPTGRSAIGPQRQAQAEQAAAEKDGAGQQEQDTDEPYAGAGLSATASETLAHKDFERMDSNELAAATAIVDSISVVVKPLRSRRLHKAQHGAACLRRTARAAFHTSGEAVTLYRTQRNMRAPVIVALCDISGSMAVYARMFAYFAAVLRRLRSPVHTFAFGTRLTKLDARTSLGDIDEAASSFGQQAPDWGGGTRIGACISEFNQRWARRLLAPGGDILLATDGLERDMDTATFEREIERLNKSCRRLIWLNPLLRYDSFEALAAGCRIINRYADLSLSIHNIQSLTALADVLKKNPSLQ